MFKKMRVVMCVGFLLFIFGGTAKALEIEITPVNVVDGGKTTRYRTTAATVGEFLMGEEIVLEDGDLMNAKESDAIVKDMRLTITRGKAVNLIVDGEELRAPVKTAKTTVEEFVMDYEIKQNKLFVYEQKASERITENMTVKLETKEEETLTEEVELPFEVEVIQTPDLLEGEEKVVQKGEKGRKETKTLVTYVGRKEAQREVISEETTKEPVNEIIHLGVGKAVLTEEGYIKYSKQMTMSATAYSLDYSCTGKNPGDRGYGITYSGMKADEGVIAVDPDVIPMGTKLYVEGYGICIAGDTGGAIQGNKIDLFYHDHSIVEKFGHQKREVYVLAQ